MHCLLLQPTPVSLATNPTTCAQIYLEAADNLGVVRVNVTVDASGFYLGESTRVTTDRTSFFTVHPDNSVRKSVPSDVRHNL